MTEPARCAGDLIGGKYRIMRFLAAGGMGAVYEAQHAVVGRRFAIKFLRPDLAQQREGLGRFQREAEAAGALESENVAAAVDFGIAGDGAPYIVMEYLVGERLDLLLARNGCLPVGRAADLVLQACRGIQVAHSAGIIHRDLNPRNLFVCRRDDGTDLVKVLDFGIAKLEAPDASTATRTGTVLGTPAYLSPEQARGERIIDHRTDIYGLGAILYELLSGQKPHPGDSHNAILHHICTQPAAPIAGLRRDLPPTLVELVDRTLSSSPQSRPSSAEELAQALAPHARRQAWPAPPRDEAQRTPSAVPVSRTVTRSGNSDIAPRSVSNSDPPGRRRLGRSHISLLAGAACAVLAIALGTAQLTRSKAAKRSEYYPLSHDTQFFVPPPNPAAVQQIADLVKTRAYREAAAVTALQSTPHAIWYTGGSPEELSGSVKNTLARALQEHRVPVLVTYNLPYRDCIGYGAGGAADSSAYRAWIDSFAKAIANERAVVILEPDGLGTIPYNTTLEGQQESCKPTVTGEHGNPIPAPGASPSERYALLNYALDSLRNLAPNAATYLDGTHSRWLPVSEIAFRLSKAGVDRARGFAVNVSNYQPTANSIRYGSWIAKCIYYASNLATDPMAAYRECPAPQSSSANQIETYPLADQWYADHVDSVAKLPPESSAFAHFVVDTSRNGQGPLDTARFGRPPFNQPASVMAALAAGGWCNPPGSGLGPRPTADTGAPFADAFLWIKPVGESDGSCDVAGGVRAWDYSKHNPWGLMGDAQNHFDPLWGLINPAAGQWFAEQALDLAKNANPPLVSDQ